MVIDVRLCELEKADESESGLIRSGVGSLGDSLLVGHEKAGQLSPSNGEDVPQDSEWFRLPRITESDGNR